MVTLRKGLSQSNTYARKFILMKSMQKKIVEFANNVRKMLKQKSLAIEYNNQLMLIEEEEKKKKSKT